MHSAQRTPHNAQRTPSLRTQHNHVPPKRKQGQGTGVGVGARGPGPGTGQVGSGKDEDNGGGDWGYARASGSRRAEEFDREDRSAHPGLRYRSAYLSIVGENPDLHPGDTKSASEVVERIRAALRRGGWTRAESRRLKRMRVKWERRAKGTDARFNVVGNRRGGLTTDEERRIAENRRFLDSLTIDLDGNKVD
jgi:hypothetical protein